MPGVVGPVRNMRRSRHQRKAVRVLPVPVGARMRVESPRAMAGQPSRCGAVVPAKVERNHSAVMGWKRSRPSSPARTARVWRVASWLAGVCWLGVSRGLAPCGRTFLIGCSRVCPVWWPAKCVPPPPSPLFFIFACKWLKTGWLMAKIPYLYLFCKWFVISRLWVGVAVIMPF